MPAADETETTLIRCHAYVCTLMARACARQHIDAKQTSAMNRDACIDCPAGAARAKAFVAGGARCPVPVDGKSCPDQPRIGSMYCERHRFHVGAIHRRSEPASEDVVVHRKRGRPPVAKPVIKPRPKPAPKPTPRVTNTCGDCGRGHLSPRPYCFQCVANAKEALRRRDRPDDWNAVVEWLAIPRAERFPKRDARTVACDRCGKERRVRSGGRTSQVGNWCGDCVGAAGARLRKAGIANGSPEQYAAELRRMGPPAGRGGVRVPILETHGSTVPLGIKWDEQPLGEVDPTELALRLGCTRSAVMSAMKTRGIEWKRSVA